MTHCHDRTQTLPVVEADLFYLADGIERPRCHADAPSPRESIEVRALLFG